MKLTAISFALTLRHVYYNFVSATLVPDVGLQTVRLTQTWLKLFLMKYYLRNGAQT